MFYKTHKKLYMLASLFRWSCRLEVKKSFWCRCAPLNFPKFLIFSITCANCCFWNLGISLSRKSSARSTLTKCTVFSSILVFIHFKLILESCTTSGVYLQPYQTSMMKLLAVAFSKKCFIIDIWQGSKYGSAASFFNIFPLSLFWYLSEYINVFVFLLEVCS